MEQEPSPRAIYKIIYTVYIRVRETMKELQWRRNHLLGLSIRETQGLTSADSCQYLYIFLDMGGQSGL